MSQDSSPLSKSGKASPNKVDPEVKAKPERRQFSAEYKRRILSELTSQFGVAAACQALAVPRSSFYRSRQVSSPKVAPSSLPARSPRALSEKEQSVVRETLNSPRFVDQAPREVYATLLDEQRYLCSWRTMYRILERNQEVQERRDQLRHPNHAKPELVANKALQPTDSLREPAAELGR